MFQTESSKQVPQSRTTRRPAKQPTTDLTTDNKTRTNTTNTITNHTNDPFDDAPATPTPTTPTTRTAFATPTTTITQDIAAVLADGIHDFDDMGLDEKILHGVYGFGFEKPSQVQARAIVPALTGQDIIIQAQSGTGKTGELLVLSMLFVIIDEIFVCACVYVCVCVCVCMCACVYVCVFQTQKCLLPHHTHT